MPHGVYKPKKQQGDRDSKKALINQRRRHEKREQKHQLTRTSI